MSGVDNDLVVIRPHIPAADGRRRSMTRFQLFSAALILSATMAGTMTSQVFAQEAIQEPGNYAFFHPNGDLLHANSPSPAPDAMAMMPAGGGKMGRHHIAHVAAKRADRYSAQ
jgi:hypothetical protein